MGGLYMYVGSGLYVWQVWKLAAPLRLGKWTIFWALFNAGWPLTLWSVSLACLLDETPTVLLDGLRLIEGQLPSMLHASLFLDPPALYPVCVILRAVVAHEQQRLARIHGHATGSHVSTMVRAGPLTDSDVATIITKRLERIGALQAKIDLLARSTDAVPTALIAPLLDTLNTEALMLEKVLEVDTAPGSQSMLSWRLTKLFSSHHARLLDELEAVQALRRRIEAVKFMSSHYAAGK